MTAQSRNFIDLDQVPAGELRKILALAADLKARLSRGEQPAPLDGKVLAMVFAQPSTRTRISFDVGMRQLGGETLVLSGNEMQLARDETIADTARVMSRFVDAIMIRTLTHGDVVELAAAATVPVINGLTRRSHPCQVMADILTFEEKRSPIDTATVAWVGDANNVLASWVQAARAFGFRLRIACPHVYGPSEKLADEIEAGGPAVEFGEDPVAAVRDADLVVTDTWVSIGDADVDERRQRLRPYRVDAELMSKAAGDALFMHCLPAHRGDEVTDEVIDGPQSVVFDEAENRLHAQKAILCWVFGIDAQQ